MDQPELILDAKASLGEGPCWDGLAKVLYFVDVNGKRVHFYDPQANTNRFIQLEQPVSAVVPRSKGGVMLVTQHGFYSLDLDAEELTALSDPEHDKPNNRFNDGKCDASGRFWAGTMSMIGEPYAGSLYRMDTDGSVHTMLDNISVSNGMGWSPDNQIMYFTDSSTLQVFAFDFDMQTGSINNRRTAIRFSDDEGTPDGLTVDEEGMLWVAQWRGWKLCRWNPHTGERLLTIPIPAERVTSCTFGGDNWDELYITTARVSQTEEVLAQYPYAGGIFRLKPGIKGLPTCSFKG